jgi:hypothetical protein
MWHTDMPDHADGIWVGDVDQNPSNGMEIVWGGSDMAVFHWSGEMMWRNNETVESQNVMPGDFRPDLPGLEIAGLDRIDRRSPGQDAIFLISSSGTMLYKEDRTPDGYATIVNLMFDWDIGRDYIAAWRRGSNTLPGLYDGNINTMATFSFNEYLMSADFFDDEKHEVIIFNTSEARIYSNGPCNTGIQPSGQPKPQPKRLYNWTRYWGGEYPPEDATGRGNPVPADPPATLCGDVNTNGTIDIIDALLTAQYYVGLISSLDC